MMRQFLLLMSAIAFTMLSGTAMASEKHTIRVAYYFPTSHPTHKSLEFFKENVEKESGGALQIQLFPNN